MKIERKSINVEHRIAFARPAVSLASQAGQLLEAIMDEVGAKYHIESSNISVRATAKLDDWLLKINLFRGLGEIRVTIDGLHALFNSLATEADLTIVSEVETGLLAALSARLPTLRYSSEKILGQLVYHIPDGVEARNAYFSQLSFPGLSERHTHRSFKAGLRHKDKEAFGMFEVAPLWANESSLFVSFDIELVDIKDSLFAEKAKVAIELVDDALKSFQLEFLEGTTP